MRLVVASTKLFGGTRKDTADLVLLETDPDDALHNMMPFGTRQCRDVQYARN
jgi:hypothetical protein